MPQKCSVCAHEKANEISGMLLDGVPLDTLAKKYGLAKSSLSRHKKHIPQQIAKAQEAGEVVKADTLLGRVNELDRKAEAIYNDAVKAKDLRTAISAVRELRGVTELYARLAGELDSGTTINVFMLPEWVHLRTTLLYALEPYPEARRAVVEALGGVQGAM